LQKPQSRTRVLY